MKLAVLRSLNLQRGLMEHDDFMHSCFENAVFLVLRISPGLQYVEGFLDTPRGLIMHGWLYDEFRDVIIDPHFAHLLDKLNADDYKPIKTYTKEAVRFLIDETHGKRFSLPFAQLEDMR